MRAHFTLASPCTRRMKQTKQSVIQPLLNWIGPKRNKQENGLQEKRKNGRNRLIFFPI